MRIRKNAKVSVLTHAYDAGLLTEMPSPHVCELNQSPWDVVVFSADALSGHFQAGEDHESFYTPDASWFDDSSVGAADESSAVASVKMSVEASGSDDSSEMMRDDQWGTGIMAREEEKAVVKLMSDSINEVKAKEKEEEEVEERLLCNRVGGRGWHCWREAAPNHSLCKHHLAQVQARAPVLRHHSSRSRKPPHPNPHSNRSEFYYYSGFGPRWGKRRGGGGGGGMESISVDNNHAAADTSTAVRTVTGKEEEEEEEEGSSEDDEMEFVDEDYDDEDEGGRKRPRKPVKARSLKSLM